MAVRPRHRGRLLRISALAATLAFAIVFVPAAGSQPAAHRSTLQAVDSLEGPILAAINRERRAVGLRPLKLSPELARAADAHARAMGRDGFFAHESRNGTSSSSRIRRYYRVGGHGSWLTGETLLWRSPGVSAGEAVAMWLASAPHRRVLLTAGFRDLGIAAVHVTDAPGAFGGRDVTIVVADFGARS